MKLSEFVEETIGQVLDGVAAAQAKAEDMKARVAVRTDGQEYVKFDVAITVTEEGGDSASVGVAGVLRAGREVQSTESSVSRIQFSIPIVYPYA